MELEEMRLECLKFAERQNERAPVDIFEVAERAYQFINGRQSGPMSQTAKPRYVV